MRLRLGMLAGLLAAILLIPAASASALEPTGDFTFAPDVPLVSQAVTFTPKDLADPDVAPLPTGIKSVSWDFGDGPVETVTTAPFAATHTFTSAGTRTVIMTITDLGDELSTKDHQVRVNSRPIARFTFSPDTPNVGQGVTLNAGGSTDNLPIPSANYDWDLDGDGQYDDAHVKTTSFTFRTPGDKTVRLRVTDSDGVTDTASAAIHVNLPPTAAFVYSPTAPVTGQAIDLTSVSRDPDGPIAGEAWDLDGDGRYDDATGKTAAVTFLLAGARTVRLRVTDSLGRTDVRAVTITVAPAAQPEIVRISPWPVIRVVGFASNKRVRIDLLSIRTAVGTTVKVRCAGKSCPRRKASSTRAKGRLVRLRWLEHRLRPGTRIMIAVTEPGRIGQYTTLTLRKKKKPIREVLCLYPGQAKATRCPPAR